MNKTKSTGVFRYWDQSIGAVMNMNLGAKFMVIVVLVIAGYGAVAYTFHEIQLNQQEMDALNEEVGRFSELVNEIEHNVGNVRFNEKEFLLSSNPEFIEKSKHFIAEINKSIDEINSIALNEQTEEIIEELSESGNNLQNFLIEMVQAKQKLGLDHDSGLHGELRKAVHDIEEVLKINKRLTLSHSMLMMRRHEKDYMARKLDKYTNKMADEQKRFAGLLADSDLSQATRDTIINSMKLYYQKFQELPALYQVIESRIIDVNSAVLIVDTALMQLIKARDNYIKEVRAEGYAHQESLARNFYVIIASVIAFVLVITIAIARTVITSMRSATQVADSIASGKLDNDFKISSEDETGQLLRSLHTMQTNLRASIETERKQARENGRIKQALDNVNGSVMIANNEGKILYTNDALLKLMQNAQADVRKELPEFNASKLEGSNISMFEKILAYQGCGLGDIEDSGTADIVVGGRSMRVVSNPIMSAENQRLGTVFEWVDRTQEVSIENEIQTIVNASLAGDLSQRIELTDKAGFFEMLSKGINDLVDVSDRIINETVNVLGTMAIGNLTKTIDSDYSGTFGQLKSNVNETINKLTVVIDEINSRASSVLNGSHEIAQGNTNLSQRTEEQAASLEETSSSMDEMTSTVRQNADYAREANQLSYGASGQAEKGGEVVGNAIASMAEITASSKKIADIIGVIDEIAFQTNLLALNAAVEAARAGEQGRGFAVVASEVRNLAGRSATAAKEIKELIEDSVAKVDEGSKLVNESGQTLEEIKNSVKKVSDIVAEIAAASEEQSSGIEQVNTAITQMDDMTQQNAALVEQAASASEIMGEEARGLNELVSFFKTRGNAGQKPVVERRSNERPWGEQAPAVNPASAVTSRKSVNSDIDGKEWEEF